MWLADDFIMTQQLLANKWLLVSVMLTADLGGGLVSKQALANSLTIDLIETSLVSWRSETACFSNGNCRLGCYSNSLSLGPPLID